MPRARRRHANRTVLGAAVVAVMLAALAISYDADTDLPFRPTYRITVVVPDAAQLHLGDQVRIGGARVGLVRRITAEPGVPPTARIELAIFGGRRLPVDSTVTIRPLSILGAKSVQLTRGRSPEAVPDGGTLGLAAARPTVDLGQALSTFDARTRAGLRGTLGGLGSGLAGRGTSLNEALAAFAPLLPALDRVASTFADPATGTARLIDRADAFATALLPVRGALPELLSAAARTFGALADPGARLGPLLSALPATERDATLALAEARPVLRDTAALARALDPAARVAGRASGRLASTLAAARPALREAAALRPRLTSFARTADAILPPHATGLRDALLGLRPTVRAVRGTTDALGPAQEHCNSIALSLRNSAAVISDGDQNGSWFSFITLLTPFLTPTGGKSDETHTIAHPIQDARGCVAGNVPYLPGRQEGNPAVLPQAHEQSRPPTAATDRARAAGLLDPAEGSRVP